MSADRFLLDTAYVQALLNRRDAHHETAQVLFPQVRAAHEVVVTEAVLIEIGNILARSHRAEAAAFIEGCYGTPNVRVVSVDTPLLQQALQLYRSRADKTWGLTDCVSFVVMQQHDLTHALTTDEHFRQAGFVPLLVPWSR